MDNKPVKLNHSAGGGVFGAEAAALRRGHNNRDSFTAHCGCSEGGSDSGRYDGPNRLSAHHRHLHAAS